MSEPDTPRVTIVTVCYHSMHVLSDMLASIPSGIPIVIIDNSGRQGDLEVAKAAKSVGAQLIQNPENKGFGTANNQGAARAETEFVFFLNPDAELKPGAIDAFISAAERYPDAVAFNPRISDRNGQPYIKRRSVLLPRSEWLPREWPEQDTEVGVLTGAAMFVRRAAFEAAGGFDENIFLYHEDDDLSIRLGQAGGKLMFIRDAQIGHLSGHSTERTPAVASLKAYHTGQSLVYTRRKHRHTMPFFSSLLMVLGQLASPLVLLSKRTRAKQFALVRGVLSSRNAAS